MRWDGEKGEEKENTLGLPSAGRLGDGVCPQVVGKKADASGARCLRICSFGAWIARGQILHGIPARYRLPAPPGEGAKLCLRSASWEERGWRCGTAAPRAPRSSIQATLPPRTHARAAHASPSLPGEGKASLLPSRRGVAGRWDRDRTDPSSGVKALGTNRATTPSSSGRTAPKGHRGQQEARSRAPPCRRQVSPLTFCPKRCWSDVYLISNPICPGPLPQNYPPG